MSYEIFAVLLFLYWLSVTAETLKKTWTKAACVMIYWMLTIALVITKYRYIPKNKMRALTTTLICIIFILLLQVAFPEYLVTSMAVADVFDAVSAKRCYRDAMPLEKCYEIIENGRGSDFDPDIVDAFMMNKDQVEEIYYKNR